MRFNFLSFNPRTYIRYDWLRLIWQHVWECFNPRTYIRYDRRNGRLRYRRQFQSTYLYKVRQEALPDHIKAKMFQSTYLYKVRLLKSKIVMDLCTFQSTYLYKVRRVSSGIGVNCILFQSTYLYKVRRVLPICSGFPSMFQSTYLYKVRLTFLIDLYRYHCFNPRTYIRYDSAPPGVNVTDGVSIHVPI